jgi:hypothetical protein
VQAISDHVQALSEALAALINDLHISGGGATHGLLKT